MLVEVLPPGRQLPLCLGQTPKVLHIQALRPQSPVEVLDEAVLCRLPGPDERNWTLWMSDQVSMTLTENSMPLSTVIDTGLRSRFARSRASAIRPDQEVLGQQHHAFLRKQTHHCQDPEPAPILQAIVDEIHAPALIRSGRESTTTERRRTIFFRCVRTWSPSSLLREVDPLPVHRPALPTEQDG